MLILCQSMAGVRSLTLFLMLALSFEPGAAAQPATPPQAGVPELTNCIDLIELSPELAKENRPARIRGVVTCYVPSAQLCFVQDATAGIYVFPSPWPKDLAAGDVVEVTGVSGAGLFSPIIQWGRIRRTGEKASFNARRIAIEELNTGRFDAQFVEVEGVVQRFEPVADLVKLEIFTGGSSATILIFDISAATNQWIDAKVRLRGVAGAFFAGERLKGFGVFLSDHSAVEVIEAGREPFDRPLRTTGKLAWFSPEGALDHRILLKGVVSVCWPGEAFFLHDDSGQIRVSVLDGQPWPKPGDLVEVAGFVRKPTSPAPSIAEAAWRKAGVAPSPLPPAQRATLSEALLRPPNGQLVAVEGTVIGSSTNAGAAALLLEDSGQILRAFRKAPFQSGLLNARVRVTGALSTLPKALEVEGGSCLWMDSPDQLVVLQRPSEPLPSSASKTWGAMAAAAAGAALVAGALAWRGQAKARSAAARARAIHERLNQAEKDLGQLKEARERLGRDLHDHIIQSIYAVGLNLEDCRQMLNDPGAEQSTLAETRLRATLSDINAVIRELRNVILGLETNAIQPQEFRAALKSLALTLGHEKSNRLRLDIDQEAVDSLSAVQTTELIHIAREAISNSIRHGQAQTTTLSLQASDQSILFTVEDDGCGFSPGSVEPTGYGLRNMAKRAQDLGAKFTVHSQEGTGTRIVLDIPKQKQHFSNSESRSRINR